MTERSGSQSNALVPAAVDGARRLMARSGGGQGQAKRVSGLGQKSDTQEVGSARSGSGQKRVVSWVSQSGEACTSVASMCLSKPLTMNSPTTMSRPPSTALPPLPASMS